MPQDIVGADLWTVTVQCAADGDAVNGASQVLMAQDLTDRTKYLRAKTIGAYGTAPLRHVPIGASPSVNNFAFNPPSGGISFSWYQTATGGLADYVGFFLPIVALTGRLTSVEARVEGDLVAGGPHAALPAVLPTLSLYRQDRLGGTSGLVATTTDTSATKEAYDALHLIRLLSLAEPIGDNITWWVRLTGEGGAGAQAVSFGVVDIRFTTVPDP